MPVFNIEVIIVKDIFKNGHFYKFKDGRAMYVIKICDCDKCLKRGLFEPYVVWLDDCSNGWTRDYISGDYYDYLASRIETDSYDKDEWVESYINKVINDNKNRLKAEIGNLISVCE